MRMVGPYLWSISHCVPNRVYERSARSDTMSDSVYPRSPLRMSAFKTDSEIPSLFLAFLRLIQFTSRAPRLHTGWDHYALAAALVYYWCRKGRYFCRPFPIFRVFPAKTAFY